MVPEASNGGHGWRAALATLAFAVTASIIYGLFSSGFGRIPRPVRQAPPLAVAPAPAPSSDRSGDRSGAPPATAGAGRIGAFPASRPSPTPASPAVPAVVSDDFWLTYLPAGLERSGGGAIGPEPGVEGGRARFGTADRFVEAQVEHGIVAADWQSYRARVGVLDARDTTVRGRPAVVGRHPSGGRVIAWLERVGTGAWIRVSESLRGELLAVAASVKSPVGD